MEKKNNIKSASRLDYMDIAKGIAILAVIVGHVYAPPTVIGKVIFSFHMPLFFVVSGYFIKDYSIKKNFISSCRGLLIPYVIGTLIEMVAELCMPNGHGFVGVRQLFLDLIGGMCKDSYLFPIFNGTWMLWFLPSLFVARIIFVLIMHFTEKLNHGWAIRMVSFSVLSAIGMLACVYGHLPWGLEIALVTLAFLYCGNLLNKHALFANKFRFLIAGICLLIWVVLLCLGFYIELAAHYWPGFYLALLEGMIASFTVIIFSQLVDKVRFVNNAFKWMGKNSLIILLIHNFDMRYVTWGKIISNDIIILLCRVSFALCVTGIISLLLYCLKRKKQKRFCV